MLNSLLLEIIRTCGDIIEGNLDKTIFEEILPSSPQFGDFTSRLEISLFLPFLIPFPLGVAIEKGKFIVDIDWVIGTAR